MAMDWGSFAVQEGDDVYGADGDKIGTVSAVERDYVVVEKGWFFPTDYYIPMSAIASYDEGMLYLNVTKDVALKQGWDAEPVAHTDYEPTSLATDTAAVSDTTYLGTEWADRATGMAPAAETTVTGDTLHVPVYEEELTATTTAREAGGVRIEKEVVTEEQTLEVPVTEERLTVVRRTVDHPVEATDATAVDATAFEELIVDVPVHSEEVEVATRARVAEEIEIQKEVVQRTEQVTGTVRREEVHVTEVTEGAVVDDVVDDAERSR